MCNGTGEISSSILVDETLERQLAYYVKEKNIKSFILEVNPILDGYLNRGLFTSVKRKWCKKYGCKIDFCLFHASGGNATILPQNQEESL